MIFKIINRIVALTIIFTLVFEQSGFAQVAGPMGIPAYINGYISPDKFRPLQLRSLSFDQINNDFNLFLDKGDLQDIKPKEIKENAAKLSEYFQIGLRLPNSTFWVNLRPDAQTQIIDPWLEKTDLGKVMLEADLQLKKDMANFTSPKTEEGKKYWDNLYKKAEELFGQSEIAIPTLTRPWIVPGEILIRQTKDNAYIYKATLKVMLEKDYLKDATEYKFDDPRLRTLNEYSSELIRQEILPKLIREVNSAKKYAGLRQVYYSLVLAQWFKQSHQDASRIDSFDLTGLTSKKSWSKTTYFKAYQKSFSKGEYRLQETKSRLSGTSIRQYFSGGEKLAITPSMIGVIDPAVAEAISNQVSLPDSLKAGLIEVQGGNVVDHVQQSGKDNGSAVVGNGSMSEKMLPGFFLTAAGLGLGIVSGAAFFGLFSIPFFYVFYGGIAGLSFIVSGALFIKEGYKATSLERVRVSNALEVEAANRDGGEYRVIQAASSGWNNKIEIRGDVVDVGFAGGNILRIITQLPASEADGRKYPARMLEYTVGIDGNFAQKEMSLSLVSGIITQAFGIKRTVGGKRKTSLTDSRTKYEWRISDGQLKITNELGDTVRTKAVGRNSYMYVDGRGEIWIMDTEDLTQGSLHKLDLKGQQQSSIEGLKDVIDFEIDRKDKVWVVGKSGDGKVYKFNKVTVYGSAVDALRFSPRFREFINEVKNYDGDIDREWVRAELKKYDYLDPFHGTVVPHVWNAVTAEKEDASYSAKAYNNLSKVDFDIYSISWQFIAKSLAERDGGSIQTIGNEELTLPEKLLRPVLVLLYIKQLEKGGIAGENAAKQLGHLGDKRAIQPLEKYIIRNLERERNPHLRNLVAEQSLRRLGLADTAVEIIYLGQLESDVWNVKIRVAERLGKIGGELSLQALDIKAAVPDIIAGERGRDVQRAFRAASEKIKSRGEVSSKSNDGGSASISSARVEEIYSAIDEITWMAWPNEDFMVKRLARVKAMIEENKYTPEEIRMVKEQLKFTNLMAERVTTDKIDFTFLLFGSVLTGGMVIGASILSGISLIPMIIGIGLTAGCGLGAAYRLYNLLKRDIPLRDLYSEYYNEVNKMLTEADQGGKSTQEAGKNTLIAGAPSRDGGSVEALKEPLTVEQKHQLLSEFFVANSWGGTVDDIPSEIPWKERVDKVRALARERFSSNVHLDEFKNFVHERAQVRKNAVALGWLGAGVAVIGLFTSMLGLGFLGLFYGPAALATLYIPIFSSLLIWGYVSMINPSDVKSLDHMFAREAITSDVQPVVREFLNKWLDQNIRGVVIFTSKNAQGKEEKGYFVIEEDSETLLTKDFWYKDNSYLVFVSKFTKARIPKTGIAAQVPLILHSDLDAEQRFEKIVSSSFTGPSAVSNWEVLARTPEEEKAIADRIKETISDAVNLKEAASRDGGSSRSLDQLRMDLMTNDIHPEIVALQGLRNDYLDLASLFDFPEEKAKFEKTAYELSRVVGILEQDGWAKSLQAGELNSLQNGDILILDPHIFAIYHSHEYLPASGKYNFLITKVDRNDPAKTPLKAKEEQLDIAGIQVLPVAPKDSEAYLSFLRSYYNDRAHQAKDGGYEVSLRDQLLGRITDKSQILAKNEVLNNFLKGGNKEEVIKALEEVGKLEPLSMYGPLTKLDKAVLSACKDAILTGGLAVKTKDSESKEFAKMIILCGNILSKNSFPFTKNMHAAVITLFRSGYVDEEDLSEVMMQMVVIGDRIEEQRFKREYNAFLKKAAGSNKKRGNKDGGSADKVRALYEEQFLLSTLNELQGYYDQDLGKIYAEYPGSKAWKDFLSKIEYLGKVKTPANAETARHILSKIWNDTYWHSNARRVMAVRVKVIETLGKLGTEEAINELMMIIFWNEYRIDDLKYLALAALAQTGNTTTLLPKLEEILAVLQQDRAKWHSSLLMNAYQVERIKDHRLLKIEIETTIKLLKNPEQKEKILEDRHKRVWGLYETDGTWIKRLYEFNYEDFKEIYGTYFDSNAWRHFLDKIGDLERVTSPEDKSEKYRALYNVWNDSYRNADTEKVTSVRVKVIETLGKLGTEEAIEKLMRIIFREDYRISDDLRYFALATLARTGNTTTLLPQLESILATLQEAPEKWHLSHLFNDHLIRQEIKDIPRLKSEIEKAINLLKNPGQKEDTLEQKKETIGAKDGGNKATGPLGGVDFRALPAAVTPMANPAAGAGLISLRDLDKQWSQIQSKIYQGEMPYQEIKLYVSSCCGQKAAAKQMETVSEGITNILKMEEERALPTTPELKEILSCLG